MERIEVITSVQRRRRYSGQEKAQFVAMTMQPGSSVPSVARQYGISPRLLFKWKRLMQDGGVTAVETNAQVFSVIDYNALLKISNSFSKGLDEKAQKFSGIAQAQNTYRTCHALYLKAPKNKNSP